MPSGLKSYTSGWRSSCLGTGMGTLIAHNKTVSLVPDAPIHGYYATLCRHAGSSGVAPQTSSLPSRHPPTHRTGTVSLATQAIGFGLVTMAVVAGWVRIWWCSSRRKCSLLIQGDRSSREWLSGHNNSVFL